MDSALHLGDVLIEVLRWTNNSANYDGLIQRNLWHVSDHSINKSESKHQLREVNEILSNCQIWITHSSTHMFRKTSLKFYIVDVNEVVNQNEN